MGGGWGGGGGGNDVHVTRMFDELFRRYMGGGGDNDVHGGDDILNFHGGSVEVVDGYVLCRHCISPTASFGFDDDGFGCFDGVVFGFVVSFVWCSATASNRFGVFGTPFSC